MAASGIRHFDVSSGTAQPRQKTAGSYRLRRGLMRRCGGTPVPPVAQLAMEEIGTETESRPGEGIGDSATSPPRYTWAPFRNTGW